MKRRSFSPAFKEKVVLQSYEVGSIKAFALELGIAPSLLYAWRSVSKDALPNTLQEVKRLRKCMLVQRQELVILRQSRSQNISTRAEKYQFIKANSSTYPMRLLCKALAISTSSYYRWVNLVKGTTDQRKLDNQKYTPLIKEIFEQSNGTYGSLRIKKALERIGYIVSRRRISRIMLANNWKSKRALKFKTFPSDPPNGVPNLLAQNFKANRLNEIWVSDLTYIPVKQDWIYLTTVMDLYDRQIIGWSLSSSRTAAATTIPAWRNALLVRNITQPLIFHSDQGAEYTCHAFEEIVQKNTLVTLSRSRTGNCWDNAVAESFFKTIKVELINDHCYKSLEEASYSISWFIDSWYNQERLHSTLDYQTPKEKETMFLLEQNFRHTLELVS